MAPPLRHPLNHPIPVGMPLEMRRSDQRLPKPIALDTGEGAANLNHLLHWGEAVVDQGSDGVAGLRAGRAAAC